MNALHFLFPLMLYCGLAQAQVDTIWSKSFNGSANSLDASRAVLSDNSGNIYSAGNTAGNGMDVCIIKYSPGGDSLWSYIFSSTDHADDYFLSMEQNSSGFIYIACCAITINRAFYIIKLSPEGSLIWTSHIDNMIGESNNKPTKRLKLDIDGNVYFTGTKDFNFLTVKLNPAGDTLWTSVYGNPGYTYDDPSALAIDDNQNVYVTGKVYFNGSYDYCTIKYNSTGDQQWARTYDGPAHNTDYSYAIVPDHNGNVYVAGSSFVDGAVNTDFCVIKYDQDGNTMWVKTFDGSYNLSDEAFLLYLDPGNNLFVGGNRYGGNPLSGGSGTDFCVVQYNESGELQHSFIYNGVGNDEDYLNDFCLDHSGNLFLTGESYSNDITYRDISLVKFEPGGNLLWQTTYSGSPGIDRGYAVSVNTLNEVIVAGEANYDFFTIKYEQVLTNLEKHPLNIFNDDHLYQNFPNPFNSNTEIHYSIAIPGDVKLTVSSIPGHQVTVLVDEPKPTGCYTVNFNGANIPPGIYYYSLQVGDKYETKKMVVIKD